MLNYDKQEIRSELTLEDIYDLLDLWGGEPEYTSFGIISTTICHNKPGEGSHKLYYYLNSGLFKCYTGGCENDVFDIFELCMKVMDIQNNIEWDLNTAIRFIANRFGIVGEVTFEDINALEDWKLFDIYNQIQEIETKNYKVHLKEFDKSILDKFAYDIKILPWLQENISEESMQIGHIGFFPGGDQITIPHFDIDGRFIGLRGRSLCKRECELYGKYRPLKINNIQYSHPLSMNLYGLNWSQDNIKRTKKAIIYEGEKSVLKSLSYFGLDGNIGVACCGSNISIYHIQQLLSCGAEEIVIALDKQYQEIDDEEFKRLTRKLTQISNKYSKYALISFMFDNKDLLGYKDSPIDDGEEVFWKLFKERIIL